MLNKATNLHCGFVEPQRLLALQGEQDVQKAHRYNPDRMSGEDERGKVRYIAGYCISKLCNSALQQLSGDAAKMTAQQLDDWEAKQHKAILIKKLTRSPLYLQQTTSDEASLVETHRRQEIGCHLTHVSDAVLSTFQFFPAGSK